MKKRTFYQRKFAVEDVQVDLILEVAAEDQACLEAVIAEEVQELSQRLLRKVWDITTSREAAEKLSRLVVGSGSRRNPSKSEIEQLADLAFERKPQGKWTPLELADLAATAGLFADIINGHRPGQKLGKAACSAFGHMLRQSRLFLPLKSGHGRRYALDHGNHHGTHHSKIDPAPFELFAKK